MLAMQSSISAPKNSWYARRRRRVSVASVITGHNMIAAATISGNVPQAPMYSAVATPPQPVTSANAQTML